VASLKVEAEVEVDHEPDVVALVMAANVAAKAIPATYLVNL
jgi:hypothetical protein